ncbi:MAG TPA: ATP-binding protein [Bryobacterales bacterium]|nr:ATP-binding protein [Bryobacterales bacterium]
MEECEFDASNLTLKFREVVPSRMDLAAAAIERIMQVVHSMPCAQENLEEVALALTEAISNAVIHGNHENPEKKVEICGACEGHDKLVLIVTDEGEGFDPKDIPDPTIAENVYAAHGRGIYLINHLMDQTEFRRGGRQVVLRKRVAGGNNR